MVFGMLPILDRIYPISLGRYYEDGTRRLAGVDDPSYVTMYYQVNESYRMKVAFFRQWDQSWYRHDRD